jgi:hypothetical protein
MSGGIAKRILAAIRVINGGLALFAPNVLGKRLGVNTRTSPGFGYAFRLFGVRTVLLGIQLWRAPDDPEDRVVREAILVHASDTAAALVVQRLGELPKAGARMAIAASAINTVLAVLANWLLRRERVR